MTDITQNDIQAWIGELVAAKCHFPQQMTQASFATLLEIANGIGPASMPWLVTGLNAILPWMKPASLPHDYRWSHHMNRGCRDDWEKSNIEFHFNCCQLAKRSCGNNHELLYLRRAEAWIGFQILTTEAAFQWYLKNAEIEPGPERMVTT